jgi:enamine deaminase RidA (YjgF/YER057c/UK114 family)
MKSLRGRAILEATEVQSRKRLSGTKEIFLTDIRRIEAGPRLSEALIYGDRIYTSGFVAETMAGKSVLEQTRDILQQIDAVLARAGSDKTRILKANIWLSDIATFDEMNKAWEEWVVAGQTPVRATVEAKLAEPCYTVEIMIEAVI